jgi:hypothetical protein
MWHERETAGSLAASTKAAPKVQGPPERRHALRDARPHRLVLLLTARSVGKGRVGKAWAGPEVSLSARAGQAQAGGPAGVSGVRGCPQARAGRAIRVREIVVLAALGNEANEANLPYPACSRPTERERSGGAQGKRRAHPDNQPALGAAERAGGPDSCKFLAPAGAGIRRFECSSRHPRSHSRPP